MRDHLFCPITVTCPVFPGDSEQLTLTPPNIEPGLLCNISLLAFLCSCSSNITCIVFRTEESKHVYTLATSASLAQTTHACCHLGQDMTTTTRRCVGPCMIQVDNYQIIRLLFSTKEMASRKPISLIPRCSLPEQMEALYFMERPADLVSPRKRLLHGSNGSIVTSGMHLCSLAH